MNQTRLKQLYSSFLLQSFPLSEGHKKAADWIQELSELDMLYAGLAESLILNKPIKESDLPPLKSLSDGLKKLQHEPGLCEQRYREYKLYLANLSKLAREVKKALDKYSDEE